MTDTARARIKMTDGEIEDHFQRLGYRVAINQLIFTSETVDDFREARASWYRAGDVLENEDGLLVVEDVQPKAGRPTRDLVVVSLGYARAVMGCDQIPAPGSADSAVPHRYARMLM